MVHIETNKIINELTDNRSTVHIDKTWKSTEISDSWTNFLIRNIIPDTSLIMLILYVLFISQFGQICN